MKYRLTDEKQPGKEIFIDVELEDEDSVPEVEGELAEKILEFWDAESLPPGRNFRFLEDGGYIVVIETHESGVPVIGLWLQENPELWQLQDFPFPSLSFEVMS